MVMRESMLVGNFKFGWGEGEEEVNVLRRRRDVLLYKIDVQVRTKVDLEKEKYIDGEQYSLWLVLSRSSSHAQIAWTQPSSY